MKTLLRALACALLAVSTAQAGDDFIDITPGADLSGWVVEGTADYEKDGEKRPVWTATDGALLCAGQGFGFIRYDQLVCDFVLRAEYRMSKGCNSGIGIRTVKYDGNLETRPSMAALEIQIEDDAGKTPDEHTSMSLYRHLPATADAVKPADQWNVVELDCRGPKIRITLNGETVQDVDQTSVDAIKDKPLCGYISLQNHGHVIEFRKLQLLTLKAAGDSGATKAGGEADGAAAVPPMLKLNLLSRSETPAGSGHWEAKVAEEKFPANKVAIVICDLWDDHWCKSASRRCDEIARRMAPLIEQAREQGVHIVHCPSDTMDFYRDSPARKRAMAAATAEPPVPIERWCYLDKTREAALPIDDSDGGCDDADSPKSFKAWTRQHPAIAIDDRRDAISDSGVEVYNYLEQEGVDVVLFVGVHTNMCVLGRSFGIRQMTRLGKQAVLIRDLTDAMYNPRQPPHVSHADGTQLVVEHIEKYWCPTVSSDELSFVAADGQPLGDGPARR